MKNNLVIVPRPIELENEHLLNDHEKIQTYFDEEIKPKLEELIRGGYDCVPFRQEFKYGTYVQSALKKAGWQIKWDSYTGPSGSWLISRRKPFQLRFLSLSPSGMRIGCFSTGFVACLSFFGTPAVHPGVLSGWEAVCLTFGAVSLFLNFISMALKE